MGLSKHLAEVKIKYFFHKILSHEFERPFDRISVSMSETASSEGFKYKLPKSEARGQGPVEQGIE